MGDKKLTIKKNSILHPMASMLYRLSSQIEELTYDNERLWKAEQNCPCTKPDMRAKEDVVKAAVAFWLAER